MLSLRHPRPRKRPAFFVWSRAGRLQYKRQDADQWKVSFNRASLRAAVLAGLLAGIAGCGVGGLVPARPPIRPGSVALPDTPLPPGEWTATGTVRKAVNSADEPAGTVIVRPWTFKKVCGISCHTLFLRQTLYGPSETVLVARDGSYIAAFPPVSVPCAHYPGEDAGTAQSYDVYTLRWSANRQQILAVEQQSSISRHCNGRQTNSWVATRTNPTARVPAPGP